MEHLLPGAQAQELGGYGTGVAISQGPQRRSTVQLPDGLFRDGLPCGERLGAGENGRTISNPMPDGISGYGPAS